MAKKKAKSRAPDPVREGDLRRRILHASVALIEQEGLGALSLREVARRAGVSHQAPYHHFADREAILGAIAEQGFQVLRDALERVIEQTRSQGAAACIAACGQTYVELACKHPAHFRVMFRPELVNLDNCPGARAEGDSAFAALTAVVHQAVKEGLPPVPSEEALVALAWSVAHGLACLILDGPLSKKLPSTERSAQIRGVAQAFGALLAESIDGAAAHSCAPERMPAESAHHPDAEENAR
jgi:AcrR family transcriptional regulator